MTEKEKGRERPETKRDSNRRRLAQYVKDGPGRKAVPTKREGRINE